MTERPEKITRHDLTSEERKLMPVMRGFMNYFPNAMMAIAAHSLRSDQKHSPDADPMAADRPVWVPDASNDHMDCLLRHAPDADEMDPQTQTTYAVHVGWRAMANLETLIREGGFNSVMDLDWRPGREKTNQEVAEEAFQLAGDVAVDMEPEQITLTPAGPPPSSSWFEELANMDLSFVPPEEAAVDPESPEPVDTGEPEEPPGHTLSPDATGKMKLIQEIAAELATGWASAMEPFKITVHGNSDIDKGYLDDLSELVGALKDTPSDEDERREHYDEITVPSGVAASDWDYEVDEGLPDRPLVYVAGRYRADTPEGVKRNIEAAKHIGWLCRENGWYPVIPHLNTAGFEAMEPPGSDGNDDFYLEGTASLLRVCDAMVMVPGHEKSSGATNERSVALAHSIPIYESVSDLPAFDGDDSSVQMTINEGAAAGPSEIKFSFKEQGQ